MAEVPLCVVADAVSCVYRGAAARANLYPESVRCDYVDHARRPGEYEPDPQYVGIQSFFYHTGFCPGCSSRGYSHVGCAGVRSGLSVVCLTGGAMSAVVASHPQGGSTRRFRKLPWTVFGVLLTAVFLFPFYMILDSSLMA